MKNNSSTWMVANAARVWTQRLILKFLITLQGQHYWNLLTVWPHPKAMSFGFVKQMGQTFIKIKTFQKKFPFKQKIQKNLKIVRTIWNTRNQNTGSAGAVGSTVSKFLTFGIDLTASSYSITSRGGGSGLARGPLTSCLLHKVQGQFIVDNIQEPWKTSMKSCLSWALLSRLKAEGSFVLKWNFH